MTQKNRPLHTLDAFSEVLMRKRIKKFHAKTIDRTQYDTEMLQKQMDLETMKIILTADAEMRESYLNECQG